jgi:hypothetical protein
MVGFGDGDLREIFVGGFGSAFDFVALFFEVADGG